jgi:hypothetical protein
VKNPFWYSVTIYKIENISITIHIPEVELITELTLITVSNAIQIIDFHNIVTEQFSILKSAVTA